MAVCPESSNSTIGDHLRGRKPKNQHLPISARTSTTDPHPRIPSIVQSTLCKSAISSLILSTFSNNNHDNTHVNSKKSVKGSTLLGLGCTSQPEVSVPGVIRSSADWEEEREDRKHRKKKLKNGKKKNKNSIQQLQGVLMMEDSACSSVGVHDMWCGADAAASASVDCVRPLSARGKIDLDKIHHRERGSYSARPRVSPEHFSGVDVDSAFDIPYFGPDVFKARYFHHLRNRAPEGLLETQILVLQNGLLMGGRSGAMDRFREWRLDIDNMTYEQLLELGEKIGYVSTGLAEDKIGRCLRKSKFSSKTRKKGEINEKCSICQEEYEAGDKIGKLGCGHAHHFECIKQWLTRKNACPVCKAEVAK